MRENLKKARREETFFRFLSWPLFFYFFRALFFGLRPQLTERLEEANPIDGRHMPMSRPTHYRCHGRHTTDALVEILTLSSYYFVTSFSWKQEQPHEKGRKRDS